MGGINSACLKPRSLTNSRASRITAGVCVGGNDEKRETRDEVKREEKACNSTETTATTKTKNMKNGDVAVVVASATNETKEKQKKKKPKKQRELSHAFQLSAFQSQDNVSCNDGSKEMSSLKSSDGVTVLENDDAEESDQINVNSATVEELMTLGGVTRPLAENVIRHRQQIGGFRYLEDIAIVNGFGAAKLNLIKNEIKLGSGNNSRNSSPNARFSRTRLPNERRISSSCSPSLLNFDASSREALDDHLVNNVIHHSSPVKNSPLPPFKPLKPSSGRTVVVEGRTNDNHNNNDKKTHRRSASGAYEYSSVAKSGNTPSSLVDVNSATVFQLMTVPSLSQALAQKIFVHRNRFGPFSSVRDLLRVKGVKANWLDGVECYLTVSTDSGGGASWTSLVSDVVVVDSAAGGSQKDDSGICDAACKLSSKEDEFPGDATASTPEVTTRAPPAAQRRVDESTSSLAERAKAALSSRPLSTSIVDTYLPFIEKSLRPNKPPVELTRDNKEIFRIASWNLQSCGNDKASNVGVTEIVCMTILEAGLAIVGFQDLRDVHVVEHICDQLNNPTLPAVKNWPGTRRGEWKNCVSHARDCRLVGFIYDSSQRVKLVKNHDYNCPLGGAIVSRATFRVGLKLKAFSVINAHFYTHDADKLLSAFSTLRDALNETARATKNSPVVVISSVASPRKSSHSWGILGLTALLPHAAAKYAAGAKKPRVEEQVEGEEEEEDNRQRSMSNMKTAADDSLLRVKPSDVNLSELLRLSVSTPHSPKRGEASGAAASDGVALSRDFSALYAALESLASRPPQKTVAPPEANIFMDVKSSTLHTGFGEVIDEGLSSPWIPADWAWGGGLSPYRPVWAEFFKEFKSVEVLNRRSRLRSSLPSGANSGSFRRFGFARGGGGKKKDSSPSGPVNVFHDGGDVIEEAEAGVRVARAETVSGPQPQMREKNVVNVRSASSFFTRKKMMPGLSKPKLPTECRRCDTQSSHVVAKDAASAAGPADDPSSRYQSSTTATMQVDLTFSNVVEAESAIIKTPVASSNLFLIHQHANNLPQDAAITAVKAKPIETNSMQQQPSSGDRGVDQIHVTPSRLGEEVVATKSAAEEMEDEEEEEEDEQVLIGNCDILSKSCSSDNATFFTCNSDFSSAEED